MKIPSCEFCECVSLRSPSNDEGLTLIWVGFLAIHFEVIKGGGRGGGAGKISRFVKNLLELS